MAEWLRHVHGGDWQPASVAGPAALAAGLNALARDAGAALPLEREPADFDRLFATMARPGD